MEQPLVSVIIPTYNRPVYLDRCINSVVSQTYKSLEIIIVDDNDPETKARTETEQLMEKYKNNSIITYIKHNINRNGSAARNTGWKASRGKYITFVDDDDIILPRKIEMQVKCLEELDESWGACYTGYIIHRQNGVTQVSTEDRQGDCYIFGLMRTMYMGSGSNLFIRKAVVDQISGYDESFLRNQDIEFLARVLENYKLAYINEQLLEIFQDSDRTRTKTYEQLESYTKHYLDVFQTRINKLSEEDKERVISVISLERCRTAFYKHKYVKGIQILAQNKVKFIYILRYFIYLLNRIIFHTSYGFSG